MNKELAYDIATIVYIQRIYIYIYSEATEIDVINT